MSVRPGIGRLPRYVPPAGACDAHCHVFGPAAVFPYAPERRYTPEDAPKEALAALHARLDISAVRHYTSPKSDWQRRAFQGTSSNRRR